MELQVITYHVFLCTVESYVLFQRIQFLHTLMLTLFMLSAAGPAVTNSAQSASAVSSASNLRETDFSHSFLISLELGSTQCNPQYAQSQKSHPENKYNKSQTSVPRSLLIKQFEIKNLVHFEIKKDPSEHLLTHGPLIDGLKEKAGPSSIEFKQSRKTGKIRVICTEHDTNIVLFSHLIPVPDDAKPARNEVDTPNVVLWRALDSYLYEYGAAKWRLFACTLYDKTTAERFVDMLNSAAANNMEDKSTPPDFKPVEIKWHHQQILKKYIVSRSQSKVPGDDDDQKYNDLQLIALQESNHDYKLIHSQFMRSAKKKDNDLETIFIYKIKQRARAAAYAHKKEQILKSLCGNVSKLNEFGLYHGTQLETLPMILHRISQAICVTCCVWKRNVFCQRRKVFVQS